MVFFFFNDTATTEIYTLSLHDALPISEVYVGGSRRSATPFGRQQGCVRTGSAKSHDRSTGTDRKSTRLNSSHANISYAVFCLKKNNDTLPDCPYCPGAGLRRSSCNGAA